MHVNIGIYVFLSFAVAALVTFSAAPFIVPLAHKIGAIDQPSLRKIHHKSTPLLGGLAIFYGFIVAVLCFGIMDFQMRGILLGSIIIIILGIFDDIRPINAKLKFLIQTLAAFFAVRGGVNIKYFSKPFGKFQNNMVILNPWLSDFLSMFWIVGLTNAVNLIDGIDGLAVGTSSIASITLLSLTFFLKEFNIAIITAALAGAGVGFLPFNLNPAKIFIGDTGSTFLGFILASVSILGLFKIQVAFSFFAPVLIFALPIFDTAFAIIRRAINKKPIMLPDRGHLHHILLDSGLSQKQALSVFYTMSGTLSLSAVVMMLKDGIRAAILIFSILSLIYFGSKLFKSDKKIFKNLNEK